jgi:hypothetical protein
MFAGQPKPASAPALQRKNQGEAQMDRITTKDGTTIFYKDWGTGSAVVFSHGAAQALLHIASLSEPPLRLLLGSDAYNAAAKHTMQIPAADGEWKDLSISTDGSF